MSVLHKLTKQERKNLNRLLKDRSQLFLDDYNIPDEKITAISFFNEASFVRNSNRIQAAIMYFISKERIRNENDFKIGVSYHTSIINSDITKILFELLPDGTINVGSGFLYYLFLKDTTNKRFVLMLKFKDGNFVEDKPKNINQGKIFKEEKCIICLENKPEVHFVDCGHICLCRECDEKSVTTICPICKTKNTIKTKIKKKNYFYLLLTTNKNFF